MDIETEEGFALLTAQVTALNTANLEIYQRIVDHGKTTLGLVIYFLPFRYRNDCPFTEALDEPREISAILTMFEFEGAVSSWKERKTPRMSLTFGIEKFTLCLEKCFENVQNFFNDPLPTNVYWDLSEALGKILLLGDVQNQKRFFLQWKDALELVQVQLGQLESHMMEKCKLFDGIGQLFHFHSGHSVQHHWSDKEVVLSDVWTRRSKNIVLRFEVPFLQRDRPLETLEELRVLMKIIKRHYIGLEEEEREAKRKKEEEEEAESPSAKRQKKETVQVRLLERRVAFPVD